MRNRVSPNLRNHIHFSSVTVTFIIKQTTFSAFFVSLIAPSLPPLLFLAATLVKQKSTKKSHKRTSFISHQNFQSFVFNRVSMGCSASRLDTLLAKAIEDPSSISSNTYSSSSSSCSTTTKPSTIPKTRSLATPLVHHPAISKGDTHHLVCLTSSTYGSLVIVDKHPSSSSPTNEFEDFSSRTSPDSVINTWELMEGLEGEDELISGSGKGFKLTSLNSCDFDDAQKKPTSKLGLGLHDSSENLKLGMLNSCDFDDAQRKPSSKLGFNMSDSVNKLSDSYVFVEIPKEIVEEKELNLAPNSKPLWKHLSEESLLSKMDPNVASSYQRALSAKKLGYDQPKRVSKSMGSCPFVSKSRSVGSSLVVSKLSRDDACSVPGSEEKIVLYYTSLRGIRRTYEDCCAVRMILRGFRVMVDEKDISMDSNYRKELQSALGGKAVSLPQLFIRGKHIGGADEIKQLHETGELGRLLDGFPIQDRGFVCDNCGESRFVPCSNCNGSRKVFQEEEGQMRRCPECNENGLVRCLACCS